MVYDDDEDLDVTDEEEETEEESKEDVKTKGGEWLSQVPEEMREKLKGYPKLRDMATKHIELLEFYDKNKDRPVMPAEDAAEEEWNKFYEKLGRPKDASGYKLTGEIPENLKSEEFENSYREIAWSIGLTKKQAANLYKWYAKAVSEALNKLQEKSRKDMESAIESLKEEWGDEYDANIEIMRRGYKKYGSKELTNLLKSTGLGNHPVFIKLFNAIGKDMTEDTLITGQPAKIGGEKKGPTGYFDYPSMKEK